VTQKQLCVLVKCSQQYNNDVIAYRAISVLLSTFHTRMSLSKVSNVE